MKTCMRWLGLRGVHSVHTAMLSCINTRYSSWSGLAPLASCRYKKFIAVIHQYHQIIYKILQRSSHRPTQIAQPPPSSLVGQPICLCMLPLRNGRVHRQRTALLGGLSIIAYREFRRFASPVVCVLLQTRIKC